MPIHAWTRPALRWGRLGLILLASGCVTHSASKHTHDFAPAPKAQTHARQLAPVKSREVGQLLQEAEEALRASRTSEALGDPAAAARQQKLMLDLLAEAEVDAAAFHALHDRFALPGGPSKSRASLYRTWAEGVSVPESDRQIRIPQPLPDRVRKELNLIQHAYPKPFQRGLDRSGKYLPYIRAELAKAGLPQELAWIIMVESQFTPKILSRSNAGGMWQFIRDTAVRYNLRMDNYVDERFNWQSSTQAAITHFKNLQNFFQGSWPLAVTAYNMGEFGLDRMIAATGGERDLWTLLDTPPASERITQEAKQYYAKYLASLIVVSDPERYGFKLSTLQPEDTARVSVPDMYALEDLNQALGLPAGTLIQLNPDLVQEVTPPNGAYTISIPSEAQEKFQVALANTPQLKYGPRFHKLEKGQTFAQVADKFGITTKELLKLNGLRSAKKVKAGQTLRGPAGFYHAGEALLMEQLADEPKEPEASSDSAAEDVKFHVVKAGEWPEKIARTYGLPIEEFYSLNNLEARSVIREGDKVIVGKAEKPKKPAASGKSAAEKAPEESESFEYEVAKGDTAGKIAAKHGVELKELLAWNHLKESAVLPLGKKLVIHPPADAPEEAPSRPEKAAGAKTAAKVEKLAKAELVAKPQARKASEKPEKMAAKAEKAAPAPRPEPSAKKSAPDKPLKAEKAAVPVTHTVAKGQNPSTIAQKYGVGVNDLYKWNKWSKKHVLQVGDAVVVEAKK